MDRGILWTLTFPATRSVLWDETPRGQTQILQLTAQRPLALTVPGRTLSLAEKHANRSTSPSFSGFLIGHPSVSPEDNSLVIAVDRFDPGRQPKDYGNQTEKQPTAIVPGDFVVPFKIWREPGDRQSSLVFTGFQYKETIEKLHERCYGGSPLSVSDTFIIHCSCSTVVTSSKGLEIHAESILLGCSLQVAPVSPIPVLQTALARTLTSPGGITQVSGLPKFGYMSMDSTRKLLLLLQTDPKAPNLPLVGIWMSGVNSVTHPDVWSACVHFAHNKNLTDRALTSSDRFLLLLYLQSDPKKLEFWSCKLVTEEPFVSLHSCHETVNLDETESEPHLFELIPAIEGPHVRLFTDTVSGLQLQRPVQPSDNYDTTRCESLPRPQPCQPAVLLPALRPDLSKACDLSLCAENSAELNQQQSPGTQKNRLSVRMPLQPVSAGNRPATTVDPVKVLKQLSPVTNGNKKPEGKENQSTDSSLESNESSQMVTKSEPVGLEGSSDGNQQSSVIVCQVLKRQEEQLNQMQLQIEMLLSGQHRPTTHSLPHPQPERDDDKSQCSASSKPLSPVPGKMSVSTNTGQSLIWSSTKSPVVTLTTDQDNEASSRDDSLVEELSPLSSCICVHQEGDTAQSITSSIHAVDLRSFNGDSTEMSESLMRETIPGSLSQLSSPAFGESASQASVLPGDFKEEKHEQGTDQSNKTDTTTVFHNIVDRIQVFLKEQSSEAEQSKQPTPQSSVHEDSQLASRITSASDTLPPSNGIGLDKDAVMKVLFGNPKKRRMTPPDRCAAPLINEHPRINYMSLSVNETMDETFDVSDVIALQYLTNVSHPDFTHVLDHHRYLNVSEPVITNEPAPIHLSGPDSFYDCNLSLASRQYLQRHNLLPGMDTATGSISSQYPERELSKTTEGTDHVLDIQRLKNLPKLF